MPWRKPVPRKMMLAAGCVLSILALITAGCIVPAGKAKEAAIITEEVYGNNRDGETIHLYTLKSSEGVTVKITNFGGIITEIHVPDKDGKTANVVAGKKDLDGYLKGHPYYGAVIGRYANRIGDASFTIDGETYTLPSNNGKNSLHGGKTGFDKVIWKPKMITGGGKAALQLSHVSPAGDQGYPGMLVTGVTYELDGTRLSVTYEATTDKATHVNMTNHSYFNLGSAHASEQTLVLNASAYTPVDEALIPTGELKEVTGTPFDFRKETVISKRAGETELKIYDHNYVLDTKGDVETRAAKLKDPVSGRTMEVYTTEPGVQLYSGNKRGVCLETQHYPDSPNRPEFPSTLLKPGEKYRSQTVFVFGTE